MNAHPYRDAVADPKHTPTVAPAATPRPAQQPISSTAECGSGWYHDVAIEQAQQTPAGKH